MIAKLMTPLPHRREELSTLFEQTLGFLRRGRHLTNRFENVLGAEIEVPIKLLDRAINLVIIQARVSHRALLITVLIEQRIDREVAIFLDVVVELGARIRRRSE